LKFRDPRFEPNSAQLQPPDAVARACRHDNGHHGENRDGENRDD
jgi:hypothetical protein